jgi:hypothetical protein
MRAQRGSDDRRLHATMTATACPASMLTAPHRLATAVACTKDSYDRGIGWGIDYCNPDNKQKEAGLCYNKCDQTKWANGASGALNT